MAPMTLALSLLLVAGLFGQQASGESAGTTVRLLVPAEAPLVLADDALRARPGATGNRSGWQRVEVTTLEGPQETADMLAADLGVPVLVERRYDLLGPIDEPGFGDQWYHANTGQSGGRTDADIDSPTAWGSTLGSGVVVAVIDSGVDMAHPDLASQIWANNDPVGGGDHDGNGLGDDFRGWDFIDNDNDPSPVGSGSAALHGTAVSGLIAAASNGAGIVGVAPSAKVMVLRACDASGCWSLPAAESIYYAVDEGADVINLSFGGITDDDPLLRDAISYARSRDVVVVAAAGNEGIDLDDLPSSQTFIPAGLPFSNIIAVGASNDLDNLSSFSNYGQSEVDIVAPGEQILTTGVSSIDSYVIVDGTSFSSPIVAGAAALLLSHDPGIGHQEVIARLEGFVDRPAGVAGTVQSGRLNIGRTITIRFLDTSGSVFVAAIQWLADADITQGCNPPANTHYCPDQRVSRGEMAVFLSRAFGLADTGTDFFDDDDGRFYEGAANRLAAAGLTVGCGSRRFCGEADIRRDEMAAMLARGLSLPATSTDRFVDDEGSVFENAINKIAAAGITEGCNPPTNNRYCPADLVTRGQMAAFIKRSVEFD